MYQHFRILLTAYVFIALGLALSCHAKSKNHARQANNNENTGNNTSNNPNPYQFGVDFGDVSGFNQQQLQNAVTIANKYGIQLIRVYDQLGSKDNWDTFMKACQDNIKVIVGISNDYLASNSNNIPKAIDDLVKNYIEPYQSKILTVLIGNELNSYLPPKEPKGVTLIQNYLNAYIAALSSALARTNINIGLSLGNADFVGWCNVNTNLLAAIQKLPSKKKIFINIYPFFAPSSDPVSDIYGNFKQCFYNFGQSLPKNTISPSDIAVGETGWPSEGTQGSHPTNTTRTNANLNCVMNGVYNAQKNSADPSTYPSQVLFFEFFDETKPGPDYESHFGLFENLQNISDPNKAEPKPISKNEKIGLNFKNPSNAQCP